MHMVPVATLVITIFKLFINLIVHQYELYTALTK